jgi:oligoribonuclease
VDEGKSPICGNSIATDRRFIRKEMPSLDSYLHYRMIDVSTIKELAARWYENLEPLSKKSEHTALSDIRESIKELRWYREKVFS